MTICTEHLSSIGTALSEKRDHQFMKGVGKGPTDCGRVKIDTDVEKYYGASLKKIKIELLHDPIILFLNSYPKEPSQSL